MLHWEEPGFRELLAHPKLAPYVTALCGAGYRLDHQPMVLLQDGGSEGFSLHGGPMRSDEEFNPELQYFLAGRTVRSRVAAAPRPR